MGWNTDRAILLLDYLLNFHSCDTLRKSHKLVLESSYYMSVRRGISWISRDQLLSSFAQGRRLDSDAAFTICSSVCKPNRILPHEFKGEDGIQIQMPILWDSSDGTRPLDIALDLGVAGLHLGIKRIEIACNFVVILAPLLREVSFHWQLALGGCDLRECSRGARSSRLLALFSASVWSNRKLKSSSPARRC